MDYDTIAKARSRMGTGLLTVVDDSQPIVPICRNIMEFFSRESCGWCTPCRDGLPWVEKILTTFEEGGAHTDDIDLLAKHCKWLGPGNTFCALAPGAVEPLQSALKYYRDEFERHITAGGCPYQEAA